MSLDPDDDLLRAIRSYAAAVRALPPTAADLTLRFPDGRTVAVGFGAAELLAVQPVGAAPPDEQALSEPEAAVCQAIRDEGAAMTAPEIAAALDRSPDSGAFTRLLRRLEKRGILIRGPRGEGYDIFDRLNPSARPIPAPDLPP